MMTSSRYVCAPEIAGPRVIVLAAAAVVLARSGNQPWGGLQGSSGLYYAALQQQGTSLQQTVTGLDPRLAYRLTWDAAERPTHDDLELFRVEVSNTVGSVRRGCCRVGFFV